MMIKVCGMRDAENIRAVEALGIDLMGFIFWPKSSRYVAERPAYLPTKCKRVGVFVDACLNEVRQKVVEYELDFVQLHGHETPEYIRTLRIDARFPSIIKAFNIATASDLEATISYEGIVDYFLFDAKGKSVGGNGLQFDWAVLANYDGETPFLLSGGIGPTDVERVKALTYGRACSRSPEQTSSLCSRSIAAFHHEKCIGIDLNSKFEIEPALKDTQKLEEFIKKIQL